MWLRACARTKIWSNYSQIHYPSMIWLLLFSNYCFVSIYVNNILFIAQINVFCKIKITYKIPVYISNTIDIDNTDIICLLFILNQYCYIIFVLWGNPIRYAIFMFDLENFIKCVGFEGKKFITKVLEYYH